MSRSYRKPVAKLKNNTFFKKYYNRKVRLIRKKQDMASGNSYKKYNCCYDICDFNTGVLPEEYIQKWYPNNRHKIERK